MKIYRDSDGAWATVEPVNELAVELRFSFGRMPGCVVVAVRRSDGTRAAEIVETLETAIGIMNENIFDYYVSNAPAEAALRSRH